MLKSKFIIPKKLYFILTIVLFALIIFTLIIRSKKTDNDLDLKIVTHLPMALEELSMRWRLGDKEDLFVQAKMNCPELVDLSQKIDRRYFECNPYYINCWLNGGLKDVKPWIEINNSSVNLKYGFKQIKNNMFIIPGNKGSYQVRLYSMDNEKYQYNIELKNICHARYLPQRVYPLGQDDLWDNFGTHIFFDTDYVTNADVAFWLDKKIPVAQMPLPAVNLTYKEMKKFCALQGKQLLSTHVFEAAALYPQDFNNTKSKFIYYFPYPWNRSLGKKFLKQDGKKLTVDECHEAYVKGCEKLTPFIPFDTHSATWAGLYRVLGHYMEAMDNPVDSTKNLKLSSFYFAKDHKYHQIGVYGEWTGEAYRESDFNFDELENFARIDGKQFNPKIAFRCMEYR